MQSSVPRGQRRPPCELHGRQGSSFSSTTALDEYGYNPSEGVVAQKIATTGTACATAICIGPLSLVTRTLQRAKAAGSSGSAMLSPRLIAEPPLRSWTSAITLESSGPPNRRISQGYLSFSIPMSRAKPAADQRFVAQTDPGCNPISSLDVSTPSERNC